jgi:hypothetical protein
MAATGLDMPAAMAEVYKALRAWPAQATPSQRRRLAALFMAANDRASAYVQWLQLPEAERRAGDGLSSALVGQHPRNVPRTPWRARLGDCRRLAQAVVR